MKRNQRHLLALIDDVLNYTRLESKTVCYAMGDVAVDEMLRRVGTFILPQLTAKRLHYEYRGCDGALTVSADDDRLQQIIVSVVTNAVKFSDEGGRVWIECDADGAAVHIHVRDTGVGIPADKLEAIFDPFVQVDTSYTRTRDGVGLGLEISRDLARGMGGDLTVESVEGRGSSFTLSLPRPAR